MTDAEKAQKDLKDAQAELTKVRGELETAKAQNTQDAANIQSLSGELETAKAASTRLTADLEAEKKKVETLTAENSRLKTDAKSAEVKLAELAAKAGVKPVATNPANMEAKSIHEQFAAITDPVERGRFYEQHEAALLGLKK